MSVIKDFVVGIGIPASKQSIAQSDGHQIYSERDELTPVTGRHVLGNKEPDRNYDTHCTDLW